MLGGGTSHKSCPMSMHEMFNISYVTWVIHFYDHCGFRYVGHGFRGCAGCALEIFHAWTPLKYVIWKWMSCDNGVWSISVWGHELRETLIFLIHLVKAGSSKHQKALLGLEGHRAATKREDTEWGEPAGSEDPPVRTSFSYATYGRGKRYSQ